jgi:hypothetical protein
MGVANWPESIWGGLQAERCPHEQQRSAICAPRMCCPPSTRWYRSIEEQRLEEGCGRGASVYCPAAWASMRFRKMVTPENLVRTSLA